MPEELDEWTKLEIGRKYTDIMDDMEDKEYAIYNLHQQYELPIGTIKKVLIEEGLIKVGKKKDYSVKK